MIYLVNNAVTFDSSAKSPDKSVAVFIVISTPPASCPTCVSISLSVAPFGNVVVAAVSSVLADVSAV